MFTVTAGRLDQEIGRLDVSSDFLSCENHVAKLLFGTELVESRFWKVLNRQFVKQIDSAFGWAIITTLLKERNEARVLVVWVRNCSVDAVEIIWLGAKINKSHVWELFLRDRLEIHYIHDSIHSLFSLFLAVVARDVPKHAPVL